MPLVNAEHAWEAVLSRDRRGDGRFVYAVSSTRVYCRPSCPSRRPARNHVMFFDSPQLAESAGYRACLRCRSQSVAGSEAEERVERARCYLDDHADEPITLRQLAAHVGLSPFHLQRTFTKRKGRALPEGVPRHQEDGTVYCVTETRGDHNDCDLRSRVRFQQPSICASA